MTKYLAFVLAAFAFAAGPLHAEDKGYPAEPLLSTGSTIIGQPIHYPTTGAAHVDASIVTVAPGGKTIMHKHDVPMFAYVLDGEITVDYGAHGKHVYHKGEALIEGMDVAHFGSNTGSVPVRILCVFMGAQGSKETIPVAK